MVGVPCEQCGTGGYDPLHLTYNPDTDTSVCGDCAEQNYRDSVAAGQEDEALCLPYPTTVAPYLPKMEAAFALRIILPRFSGIQAERGKSRFPAFQVARVRAAQAIREYALR